MRSVVLSAGVLTERSVLDNGVVERLILRYLPAKASASKVSSCPGGRC